MVDDEKNLENWIEHTTWLLQELRLRGKRRISKMEPPNKLTSTLGIKDIGITSLANAMRDYAAKYEHEAWIGKKDVEAAKHIRGALLLTMKQLGEESLSDETADAAIETAKAKLSEQGID